MELDSRTAAIIALGEARSNLDVAKSYVLRIDQNYDVQPLTEAMDKMKAVLKDLE